METIRLRVTLSAEGEFWARAFTLDDADSEIGIAQVVLNREFDVSPLCPLAPTYRYGDAVLAGVALRIWQDADDDEQL